MKKKKKLKDKKKKNISIYFNSTFFNYKNTQNKTLTSFSCNIKLSTKIPPYL